MTIESTARDWADMARLVYAVCVGFLATGASIGCSTDKPATQLDAGSAGGAPNTDAGSAGGAGGTPGSTGGNANVAVGTVTVSAAAPRPRTTTWSVNYWMWMPSLGDNVSGTETRVAALKPAIMRVGGYNNDANTPDGFTNAQLDRAIAYAQAIGAEPVIQVPHLWDIDGSPATPESAAATVKYANVTKGYGIKYFAVGNEPDIYATQGSRSDSTKPAIPNYTPSDFCASARTYVTAMKAVDPSIAIVGPDLAWQYQSANDWLTPILQTCGDLFDIVSIHRYPFDSTHATLDAASNDATTFANVLTTVRGLMQAAGAGNKPLALMEMNVAYDATRCQLGASPGTTGSALWMADDLGTGIENNLWTSAIWDISDDDIWALGLIGPAPSHKLRPEYYAYQLYADHFGPTLLDITQQPPGVRAYASRNQADTATDLIVVNWSTSSAPLSFQVTGIAATSNSATFTLPALSISAVEIPDSGNPKAWTYGDAQNQTGAGLVTLEPGATPAIDAGPPQLANSCSNDASVVCSKVTLQSPSITTLGSASGSALTFGAAPNKWNSYSYAASGQTPPVATVTAAGNGIHIVGGFVAPVTSNWVGNGLYFVGSNCIDGTTYTGVKFDFSGDLDGCALAFGSNFSGDASQQDDPARGGCAFSSSICYPPQSVVTTPADSDAGPTTIKVPFTALGGGSPIPTFDKTSIITVQWQLNGVSGGPGCSADFTVENVAFY